MRGVVSEDEFRDLGSNTHTHTWYDRHGVHSNDCTCSIGGDHTTPPPDPGELER